MFSLKPEYEQSKKRYDAFWEREIVDRPPVSIDISIENPKKIPEKKYSSFKEKWLDIDFRVEREVTALENKKFLGDAMPIIFPNMGPEIFSAWCGCGYEYGEDTTWSQPCIEDWEHEKCTLDLAHPLFTTLVEFTEKLIEAGRGKFITGLTDFHPGGDHIAALRDPQNLALDMIENAGLIKTKVDEAFEDYKKAFMFFYEMLRKENLPITSWLNLIYDGMFYIPSNDFSCMISTAMFEDVFLPGIIKECQFYEKSIYHLDGPGALRHLDVLLDIKELDAVQWVPGAGNEGFNKWIAVYQKIQKKNKGVELRIDKSELGDVFENLNPQGIWFAEIKGIQDEYTANEVIKRIEAWR